MNDQQELKDHLIPEQPIDYARIHSKRVDEHFPNAGDEQQFNWMGIYVVLALMVGIAIGFAFGVTR